MKPRTKKYLYVVIVLFLLGFLYALKNTSYFVRAADFIAAFVAFFVIDTIFKLRFRNRHYIVFIFIATTGILFSPLYYIYPNYDKILHLVGPFLICILIFYLINRIQGIGLPLKLFLTVSIVVSLLAFWELFEFFLDKVYNMQMQGVFVRDVTGMEKYNMIMDRNDDTMIDMLMGTMGSVVFAAGQTAGHFLKKLKNKIKNKS